jgi:ethanolamine utilization microcompartment shell protein EutL
MPPSLLPAATGRRPWQLFFSSYGGIPAGTAHSVCIPPPLAAISSALRRCYVAIATFFLPPAAASFFVAAATNFAAF